MSKNLEGLVHVYTGDGKGKTTASVGLGIRASLNFLDVIMIKFIKGNKSGEDIVNKYVPNFEVYSYGTGEFITGKPGKDDEDEIKKAWDHAEKAIKKYDMVILDEVIYAVQMGLIKEHDLIDFIDKKPKEVELVLTGGIVASKKIRDKADYVSIIMCAKHPYKKGIPARKGIEY
ncbi:MAG: cob(I)yrinic acid a,c-diamide adenosyltransferase [Nanoarchaeota archaeon]|nr:cob(I)yrinic acid a,c-diamide adenosyltransferase [Nanoarchaeota archaeon]MCG2718407.1 cob(I)yrinic acid a,c-diamide adenosyltransferase [Nanoarchaeota archaeon]